MPTLTETLKLPAGVDPTDVAVELQLWGVGTAVTGFEQTNGQTIAGKTKATGAAWSIASIVGNNDIELPTGTTYRVKRSWPGLEEPLVDYITMPTGGGPYRVDQVLTTTPATIPSSAASSEIARYSPGSNSANIAVNGLTFVPVPSATFDIPDLSRPALIFGSVNMQHATVADSILYAGVALSGVTSLSGTVGLATARAGVAGVAVSVSFIGRVPAHSAGTYAVGVNGNSGNVVVVGGPNNITHVVAVQV